MCDAGQALDPHDELEAAVARFLSRTRGIERDDEELQRGLIRTRHIIDTLQLDFSHDAARFCASRAWDDDAWTSPIGWLTNVCHMAPGEATAAVCVGENASALQRTVEKVDAGAIGFAHLVLMARTNEALQQSGATLDEGRLLARAETRSPHEFRRDCAHARHRADAAAFHARQQECADARFLDIHSLGGDDGGFWIKGFLDAAGGAVFKAALEPLARRTGAFDDRARDRRLADALVEMAGYTLDTGGQGATHCQVPHLQITASLDTLMLEPGCTAGELEGSVPVSAATVQRFSCSANVRRILLDPESLPVDVGRARRTPGTATAIKVKQRDQGCVWPRCRRTARWVEIHHVKHWTRDHGATEEGNLVCLCWRHHENVHLRGWQIVRVPGQREVLAIPPIPPSDPLNRGPSYQHAA
jgi:Domain of unknown function (DUF222)